MDTTNVVVVVVIIIVAFILLSACCRGMRHAYEDHLTNEELARRRQAFYITQASRNLQNYDERRAVRVTTISREGDRVALGVYEIRVPRRPPNRMQLRSTSPTNMEPSPPPFSTALQVSSPITYIDMEEPPPSYDEYLKFQSKKDEEDDKPRY